jgi:hypothetical protein
MNKPARETIDKLPRPGKWRSFGFHSCRIYIVSMKYPIKKLRGARVQIIGPDSWEGAKEINGYMVVKNTRVKVIIIRLRKGIKSKEWEPVRWKDKRLKNGAIKVKIANRKKSAFDIQPRFLLQTGNYDNED